MINEAQTIPPLSCIFVYPEDPPFNALSPETDGADVDRDAVSARMTARGMATAKQIRLNAFDMNTIGHQSPGPVDASARPVGFL